MYRERVLQTAGRLGRRLPPSRSKNRVGRVFAFLLGDPPAVRAEIDGVRYLLRPAGRTESGMFWSGEDEDHVIDLLSALTPSDGTFVDIGANVGLVGLRVAMRAQPRRTILIEPVPSNIQLLANSIRLSALSSTCTVLPYGLGEQAGEGELFVEGDETRTGNAGPVQRPGTRRVMIELRTLDELIEGRIDVVKIDVEGAEPSVFKGAMRTMATSLPIVYGEFSDVVPGRSSNIVAVMSLLGPLGYRCFAFAADRRLVEFTPTPGKGNALLVPAHFTPPEGWRFDPLAVDERPGESASPS